MSKFYGTIIITGPDDSELPVKKDPYQSRNEPVVEKKNIQLDKIEVKADSKEALVKKLTAHLGLTVD